MKKFQLFNWILFALLALQFSACEDQASITEIPGGGGPIGIGDGEFVAIVEGAEFESDSVSAYISLENILVLTGINTVSGESIIIRVQDPIVGILDITAGIGNQNIGIYTDGEDPLDPYTTDFELGGTGELTISNINDNLMTISGTFSFTAAKNFVDASGNTITEIIEIESGQFSQIPLIYEDEGDIPLDGEFSAKVDGFDFNPISLETRLDTIGGTVIITLEALNNEGALIRIDIPEDLGVGTFEMSSLSNGTNLIGLYNSNTGGENLTSSPGTIEITEFFIERGIIEATFNFTASDPLHEDSTIAEITEGAFKIVYGSPEPVSIFKAEIDGELFSPDSLTVEELLFEETSIFVLTAIDSETDQKIELFFPSLIEVGVYEMSPILIDGSEKVGEYIPDTNDPVIFSSNPGEFTITEYNLEGGIIEGTFSFNALDNDGADPSQYEITEGEFTLVFQL